MTSASAAGSIPQLQKRLGFPDAVSFYFWLILGTVCLPITLYFQLSYLANPLVEPHLRQAQTGLTTYYFAKHQIEFFNYRSPLEGKLWSEVHELPVYQWVCARLMNAGLSLEVASRGVSLFFFYAGWVVLILILSRLFDGPTTAWTALLYLASPFSIQFSRAGLIDYPCLFFLLLGIWCYLKALAADESHFVRWALGLAFCGSLAAAIKVTIWLFPTLALSFHVIYLFIQKKQSTKRLALLAGALFLQGLAAIAWTLWARHINQNGDVWIFGVPQDRINLKLWATVIRALAREVLFDWMVPAVVVGLLSFRRKKWALGTAILLVLIPLVTFEKVHSFSHHYYFIVEIAFLFTIAGAGFAEMMAWPQRFRNGALVILTILFVWKLTKVNFVMAEMRERNSGRMQDGLAIKAMTDPQDVVFFEEIVLGSGYEITLYSERHLLFINGAKQFSLEPTAIHFTEEREIFFLLNGHPLIWVTGFDPTNFLYRTRAVGAQQFEPLHHPGVLDEPANVSEATDLKPLIDVCAAGHPVLLRLPRASKEVDVLALDKERTLVLPYRKFLSLPSDSPWGCKFQVSQRD